MSSLWVSLRVVGLSMILVLPLGLGLGWVLARRRFPGRTWLDALILFPLVLPPSVVGELLLQTFGRSGPLGLVLERWFGLRLVFTLPGAALAAAVVAFPLMAKGSEMAFGQVDHRLEEIAAVHGMTRFATFRWVSLPLAAPGLLIALLLTTLRALGEFGATLTFAGYLPGQTGTAPLAIYMAFQAGDDGAAWRLVLVLALLSWLSALALALAGAHRRSA